MKHLTLHSNPLPYLNNEVDFLAFIGVNTANIIRYVRTTKHFTKEMLAKKLGITLSMEKELEHMQSPLSDQLRSELRLLYM